MLAPCVYFLVGALILGLTIRCFHKRRKPDFDVWPVSGNARQSRSRGKETPHKERRLLCRLHPLILDQLSGCSGVSTSPTQHPLPCPTSFLALCPLLTHSSPSSSCGFSRTGCSLKTQKENVPENQILAKDVIMMVV